MEYYERYRRFEKRETNPLIDEPLNFFRGFTKGEVLAGVLMFVAAIYISSASLLLMILFAFLSVGAPMAMQHLRLHLPKNYFALVLWHFGLWNGKNKEFNRLEKSFFSL